MNRLKQTLQNKKSSLMVACIMKNESEQIAAEKQEMSEEANKNLQNFRFVKRIFGTIHSCLICLIGSKKNLRMPRFLQTKAEVQRNQEGQQRRD